jgi:hypothetical protein
MNAPAARGAATLAHAPLPTIVSFVAADADNGDGGLGRGDTLRIEFDRSAQPSPTACAHMSVTYRCKELELDLA